jgi:ferredoxin-NADP reductase
MQNQMEELDVHHVFFTDSLGIASIFPIVKSRLTGPPTQHVTLFYYAANSLHIFRKELDILLKHFPTQLFVNYYSTGITDSYPFLQEDIEAVLNANTLKHMNFIISGNESFGEKISELLHFLGIGKVQIQEQYFSE